MVSTPEIADSTGGEQVAGNDAITNFLRPLIYSTLLEVSNNFGVLKNMEYTMMLVSRVDLLCGDLLRTGVPCLVSLLRTPFGGQKSFHWENY